MTTSRRTPVSLQGLAGRPRQPIDSLFPLRPPVQSIFPFWGSNAVLKALKIATVDMQQLFKEFQMKTQEGVALDREWDFRLRGT